MYLSISPSINQLICIFHVFTDQFVCPSNVCFSAVMSASLFEQCICCGAGSCRVYLQQPQPPGLPPGAGGILQYSMDNVH